MKLVASTRKSDRHTYMRLLVSCAIISVSVPIKLAQRFGLLSTDDNDLCGLDLDTGPQQRVRPEDETRTLNETGDRARDTD